jgi:hypothetical protein
MFDVDFELVLHLDGGRVQAPLNFLAASRGVRPASP